MLYRVYVMTAAMTLVACGAPERTQRSKTASMSQEEAEAFYLAGPLQIGVALDGSGGDSFSFVQNALTGYGALLIGGQGCWGPQGTTYDSSNQDPLVVRRGALGCGLAVTELRFEDAAANIVFQSTDPAGLSVDANQKASFSMVGGARHMLVTVVKGFATSGDGKVTIRGAESAVQSDAIALTDCDKAPVEDPFATFRTPLSRPYAVGDMGRRSLDGSVDKHRLQSFVNERCIENFDPNVDSTKWSNPVLSSDAATRDSICQMYGYQRATGSFGYYKLASPGNDHAAFWSAAEGRMLVNKRADMAPTNNQILVWTECQGKIYGACKERLATDFRCKN